eukprot:3004566-Rhodomonas_salina.2
MEPRKVEELEEDFQARIAAALVRLRRLDEEQRRILDARKTAHDLLQVRCPPCSAAFDDFDGCCALKCTRSSCGFGAGRRADCGADAPPHLVRCTSTPPAAADLYFGRLVDVQQVQQEGGRAIMGAAGRSPFRAHSASSENVRQLSAHVDRDGDVNRRGCRSTETAMKRSMVLGIRGAGLEVACAADNALRCTRMSASSSR